jgi:sugar lactone lactonase YvrE
MPKLNLFIKSAAGLIILLILLTVGVLPVLADAHVEWIAEFNPLAGELPEGIAVDKVGNIFYSLDPLGQVWKISPDGTHSLYHDFGGAGVVGLAVDAPGNVYVARNSFDETDGVWRLNRDGSAERLPGSEAIFFPNSLAFDKVGNLYVTDTYCLTCDLAEEAHGAVWRIAPGGAATMWIQDELLQGTGFIPNFEIPIGANGIAYRQGNLYVANTEKASIVKVPIMEDGSAGEPSNLVQSDDLFVVDGLALDVHGNIYALVISQSKLVRIDPEDGSITTLATGDDGLDFPASLAFGTGKSSRKSVFVTNYAIGGPMGTGNGPGILKIDVGIPGMPLP